MKTITGPLKVYHNPNFTRAHFSGPMPTEETCVLVATVETANLDTAYERTNSFDHHWIENSGLTVHNGNRHRSTSMGDLIVDKNGNAFICAAFGWQTPSDFDKELAENRELTFG